MIDPDSSIRSSPAIVSNKVGSDKADTISPRLNISSAQSHQLIWAWYADSVNCCRSYDMLQSAFAGARTHTLEDIQVATTVCLKTPYTTPAQVPVETVDVSQVQQDMDKTAENPLPAPYFDPINEQHFTEWVNYNANCDASAQSSPQQKSDVQTNTDVLELLKMIKSEFCDMANMDKPIGRCREQEFAWEQNINPLAWATMILLNSNPVTFLPREEHRIVAKIYKAGKYFPPTIVDIKAWQHYVKNPRPEKGWPVFFRKRNINYDNLSKFIDAKGEPSLSLEDLVKRKNPKGNIFVPPQLRGTSNQFSKPITPECLKSWSAIRKMPDYGIDSYLSKTDKWSPEMKEEVSVLRECQKNGLVLTVENAARKCNGAPAISEKIITDVENWDRMTQWQRLGYAMEQFASSNSLDGLCWDLLAWSNELASAKRSMQEEAVKQISKEMMSMRKEAVEQISKEWNKVREMLKVRVQKVIEYRWPSGPVQSTSTLNNS